MLLYSGQKTNLYKENLNSSLIFDETDRLRNLSSLLNEAFIEIYHERVKDMPTRPMFRKSASLRSDFDSCGELLPEIMKSADKFMDEIDSGFGSLEQINEENEEFHLQFLKHKNSNFSVINILIKIDENSLKLYEENEINSFVEIPIKAIDFVVYNINKDFIEKNMSNDLNINSEKYHTFFSLKLKAEYELLQF